MRHAIEMAREFEEWMLDKTDCVGGLTQAPFEACSAIDGDLSLGLLIVVDHSGSALPARYRSDGLRLGLPPEQFERHIAYDIGIRGVAEQLNKRLKAPVVMAHFSRLLIDPNRGVDDPTLIMKLSDGAIVPGNALVDEAETEFRKQNFYEPYHKAIAGEIDRFLSAGIVPVILSLHSFTSRWRGTPRKWHTGVLWDKDPRFAQPFIKALHEDSALIVGDNAPYTGRLKGDCMYRHGTSRGLAHALLEIRQDLIEDEAGQIEWASRLGKLLKPLFASEEIIAPCREIRQYGSHSF